MDVVGVLVSCEVCLPVLGNGRVYGGDPMNEGDAGPVERPAGYPAMRPVDVSRVPSGRRRWRLLAVVAVVAAVGLGGAVWALVAADGRRCEASRVELRLLEAESILTAAPSGAVPVDRYTTLGCEDDDGIGVAGQSFRYGGDRDELVSFYRSALARQGWTVLPGSTASGVIGSLCARRLVGGQPASALVALDRTDPARYAVEVSSGGGDDGDGGGWCS